MLEFGGRHSHCLWATICTMCTISQGQCRKHVRVSFKYPSFIVVFSHRLPVIHVCVCDVTCFYYYLPNWKNVYIFILQIVSINHGHGHLMSMVSLCQDLAANRFWTEASIGRLPWHGQAGQPLIGQPQFHLHQSIVDSIAPAMPLKAVFSRAWQWLWLFKFPDQSIDFISEQ